MKLINPSVELWEQPEDWREQVARAARLCYATEQGKRDASSMCTFLSLRGHNSMFRHGSAYFYLTFTGQKRMPGWLYARLKYSPYVGIMYYAQKDKDGTLTHHYYVSTNRQFITDDPAVFVALESYELSPKEFISVAKQNKFHKALRLLRFTVCVTTQIGTSRELNRTSPNNIAEQSTRYVNFDKRGGVTFVRPYWWSSVPKWKRWIAMSGWKVSELFYGLWLKLDLPPQAARGFLMLETGTRVAYTYNVNEWQHILDLRLRGTTGKPHPDAVIVAKQINQAITAELKAICPGETFLVD